MFTKRVMINFASAIMVSCFIDSRAKVVSSRHNNENNMTSGNMDDMNGKSLHYSNRIQYPNGSSEGIWKRLFSPRP